MTDTNPLTSFYRHSDFTVKLPSQLKWYPEGFFTKVSPTNELEVYPMSINDEYLLKTNDALMSGSADIDIIKSCVPAVSDPKKLLYPDALVLMLAIRKATTGDKFVFYDTCADCIQKALEVKDEKGNLVTDPKKLREEYDIEVEQQPFAFSIQQKLNTMTMLDEKYELIEGPLTFELRPLTLEESNLVNINAFYQYNMIKVIEDDTKLSLIEKKEKIYEYNKKIVESGTDIVVNGITKIICKQNGEKTEVTDKAQIKEFIQNSKSELVSKISKMIEKLNTSGVSTVGKCKCAHCGKEWEIEKISYDLSNFFAYGS